MIRWMLVGLLMIAVLVAIAVAWVLYVVFARIGPDFGDTTLDLLPMECSLAGLMLPSISTLTMYDGTVPAEVVRSRTRQILQANPWLGSRLIRCSNRAASLRFYANSSHNINDYVDETTCSLNFSDGDNSYDSIATAMKDHMVPQGITAINSTTQRLFKVTLITDRTGRRSGLLLSLNHILGDGHTFYSIYRMLDPTVAIRALISRRSFESSRKIRLIGDSAKQKAVESLSTRIGMLFNLLIPGWIMAKRTSVHRIDEQKVSEIKNADKSAHFLSTNDIVTSKFFSAFAFDLNLMAVNYRHRVLLLGDLHVGNYEDVIVYTHEECRSPALIRASLEGGFKAASGATPSAIHRLLGRSACISNWATFFHDLRLGESCIPRMHIPLTSGNGPFGALAILFRPNPDQLAIITDIRQRRREQTWIQQSRVLSNTLIP